MSPEQPQPNEYSRESYDAAQARVDAVNEKLTPSQPASDRETARQERDQAEGERDHLYEMGWDEALKLNAEYNQAIAEKEATERKIADLRHKMELDKEIPEREANPEITKESEIKATVEFWHSLGVEVDEADVREKIEALPEVEGYDRFVYVPKGIKISEVWEKMSERYPNYSYIEGIDEITSPRDNQESAYAIATKFQEKPDEDSLGDKAKSPEEWEKTDDTFMSPMEYMIAEMRYHAETGQHLDGSTATWCPGSRTAGGNVPFLRFDSDDGKVVLNGSDPGDRDPRGGVRRVVTSEK
jgi:hypothetical protein